VKPANRKKLSFSRDLISLKRRSVQAIKVFGLEVPYQLSGSPFWPRADAAGRYRDYFRIADQPEITPFVDISAFSRTYKVHVG
jgi:hypothetical protein